jgi:hypothetical protein
MKKLLFVLSLTLSIKIGAQEIHLSGNYQGKNLIVMNPFAATGVGFCIFEVKINGLTATDEINSSSFELDLANYKLRKGDALEILLKHKDGCKPKVLNPEVLKPQSTFKISNIKIDRTSESLVWTTTDENGKLPFVIQQFKWNKWTNVGEIEGKGTPGQNTYQFKLHITSGENKFRVKQTDFTKTPRYSEEAIYRSLKANVTYTVTKKAIVFSAETAYEIYDMFGKKVLTGFGNTINVEKLAKGKYYLNFDSQMAEFKL